MDRSGCVRSIAPACAAAACRSNRSGSGFHKHGDAVQRGDCALRLTQFQPLA
jgi:hypothetical protein